MEKKLIALDILLGAVVVFAIIGGFLYGEKTMGERYKEYVEVNCECEEQKVYPGSYNGTGIFETNTSSQEETS